MIIRRMKSLNTSTIRIKTPAKKRACYRIFQPITNIIMEPMQRQNSRWEITIFQTKSDSSRLLIKTGIFLPLFFLIHQRNVNLRANLQAT